MGESHPGRQYQAGVMRAAEATLVTAAWGELLFDQDDGIVSYIRYRPVDDSLGNTFDR